MKGKPGPLEEGLWGAPQNVHGRSCSLLSPKGPKVFYQGNLAVLNGDEPTLGGTTEHWF